nr:PREDICTED: UDP-glucuronosyltransferase 2A1-like [Latimeria chalumnae]|eukprot:XP_014353911.1 PREDICTED: UDP-glucuronosyltransferase 2A1-like [Latimeria chalumnae]
MASVKGMVSIFVFLPICFTGTVFCGHILVWPGEASHWINMKPVLEELINKGHRITILTHTGALFIKYNESPLRFEIFTVPFKKDSVEEVIKNMLQLWIYDSPNMSYWQMYKKIRDILEKLTALNRQICDGVLKNAPLLEKLQIIKFDILFSDPVTPCSEMVAEKLGIPFIYSLRFSIGNIFERLCGQLPSPPSYVPFIPFALTDRMSFTERLKNFLFYFTHDLVFSQLTGRVWNNYYSEILGRPTTFCEAMGKAEIWLIRTYWDFEYPRPLLPNFKFVGGLHCRPAKPLPEEMEKFIQSSGEHGIVVVSFGSMIKNLTKEKGNIIAAALRQVPQKVLWRYSGELPDTLGPNTKVYDWIPQNDLLGHPKTKAFITHGGTNGIYEAIYHGVPMIGIPMFADQPDNMVHMKAKGAALVLNFNTMTTQDLVDALNTVINTTTYKDHIMKLSRIHHDQPLKPLDTAVFWIEFVMRHKGAKHLRPAAHSLTWYQYHCLDVIAFLLTCLASITFMVLKCCKFCFRRCGRLFRAKNKIE